VEGLAGGEADVAQRLLQVFGLDVLVAGDLEALDGGPLEHHDDELAAVAANLYVAEEAGGIERAHRFAHPLRREPVADVDGQVVLARARGDALRALALDVPDGEVGLVRRDGRGRGGAGIPRRAGVLRERKRRMHEKSYRDPRTTAHQNRPFDL